MGYIVIDKNDCFGLGDTLEEALENLCNEDGDTNFSSFAWFETKPVNVKLVASAIAAKPKNTKEKI